MIWQLGALVAALLGVAATAGWLEFGRTARVKRARAEAELLALMPAGEVRDDLADKLEHDVRSHLRLEADRHFRFLLRLGYALVVANAVAVAFFVGNVLRLIGSDAEELTRERIWLILISAGAVAVFYWAIRIVVRRLRAQVARAGR